MRPTRAPDREAPTGPLAPRGGVRPAAGATGTGLGWPGPRLAPWGLSGAWQPGAGPAPIPGPGTVGPRGPPTPPYRPPAHRRRGPGTGGGEPPARRGQGSAPGQAALSWGTRARPPALGGAGPEGRPPAPWGRPVGSRAGGFCTCSVPTGQAALTPHSQGGRCPPAPGSPAPPLPTPSADSQPIPAGEGRVLPSPQPSPISLPLGFPWPPRSHPAQPQTGHVRLPLWGALPSWLPPSQRPGPDPPWFRPPTGPTPTLSPACLVSNPSSTPAQLCGPSQLTQPLWASVRDPRLGREQEQHRLREAGGDRATEHVQP